MKLILATLMLAAQVVAQPAQTPAPASTPAAAPRTILFIGNSFTYGAGSPALRYRADTVTDLNGDGIGGVPALFKRFTEQAGLNYTVSLETSPGKGLDYHWQHKRALIDRPWDVVVMQGYSILDPEAFGDPTKHVADAKQLAAMFTRANPAVQVELVSTWTRPDLTFQPGSPWSGKAVTAMAADLRAGSNQARSESSDIDGIAPVGEAFSRAIAAGIADANPYDGISFGQVGLWTYDHYHASIHGYYLEALVVFGRVTGVDPRTLGPNEKAADDLGIEGKTAAALQQVAWEQLNAG